MTHPPSCRKRYELVESQKTSLFKHLFLFQVLSLIQVWSDTFRGQPDLSGVVQVYNELKSKGIEFPPPNYEHMVPIHTPQRSVPVQPPHTAGHYGQPVQINPAVLPLNHVIPTSQRVPVLRAMHMPITLPLSDQSPLVLNEEQLAKVRAELDVVNGNFRVFKDMLNELDKTKESQPEDWELLVELHQTCQAMQKRIVELLDRVANEELTSDLLRINDDLNSLFIRFDAVQAKRSQQPLGTSPFLSPASAAVSTSNAVGGVTFAGTGIVGATAAAAISATQSRAEEATLIDLDDTHTNAVGSQLDALTLGGAVEGGETLEPMNVSRVTPKAKPSQAIGGEADFDIFAQLRSDKKEAAKLNSPNEQEIQEMEKWLQSQPDTLSNSGNTLSNSDFDRFLAQRAVNMERQPNIGGAINPAETKPKQLDDPFGL